jgi:hypothetical protein
MRMLAESAQHWQDTLAKYETYFSSHPEQIRKTAEAQRSVMHVQSIATMYKSKSVAFSLMSLTGFGMCIVGFRLWYTKLQRHLDKRVEREVGGQSEPEAELDDAAEQETSQEEQDQPA